MILRQKNTVCFENYDLTFLDICTMDYPKLIVSNQKEESISIQWDCLDINIFMPLMDSLILIDVKTCPFVIEGVPGLI